MNPLQPAQIQKTGHNHSFEHAVVAESTAADAVTLALAIHLAHAAVSVLRKH